MDYAAAALAGLPPDDEAAVLARLAAASGKSLQDLVAWSYQSGGGARAGGATSGSWLGRAGMLGVCCVPREERAEGHMGCMNELHRSASAPHVRSATP